MNRVRMIVPAVSALIVLAACGGASADPDAPLDTYEEAGRGVLFVDPDDLHEWMEAGHDDEVVFVDNRNAFTFEQQRIAGARLIPTDQMARSVGSLPLNKWIVLYCT